MPVPADPAYSDKYAATHGRRIAPVASEAHSRLRTKKDGGKSPKLSKGERAAYLSEVNKLEAEEIMYGLNFSRIQIDDVLRDAVNGVQIEYETLGPYLGNYIHAGGRMTQANLTPEDRIGLALAVTFRQLFPQGHLVSLADEYNAGVWRADLAARDERAPLFSATAKHTFIHSLVRLFKDVGALDTKAVAGKDYVLLPESEKVGDAKRLTQILEATGCIVHGDGEEIIFVNDAAENPLHRSFSLRTKHGRWLCEALDAATFLKPENIDITHIVVLPNYMKEQQDKVWEILRVLGMSPHKYHNIFYDPSVPAEHITQAVGRAVYIVWSGMER